MSSSCVLCCFPSVKKQKHYYISFCSMYIKKQSFDSVLVICRIIEVYLPRPWLFWISQKRHPIIVYYTPSANQLQVSYTGYTFNFKPWKSFLEWFKECLHYWFVLSKPQASHYQVVNLSPNINTNQSKDKCYKTVKDLNI